MKENFWHIIFLDAPLINWGLGLDQNGHEVVEVGGVDVADGDDAQVRGSRGTEIEARAGAGESDECGAGGSLRNKDGDFMFVKSEEEQGCGLAVEVGEVRALEGGVRG